MATVDILCVRATAVSVLAGDTTPGFADCDDSGAGGALLDRPQVLYCYPRCLPCCC